MVAPVPPATGLSAPPAPALRLVPGLELGQQPLACCVLPGGTVNRVWRIRSSQGEFALRVDGPAWRRPGVDRRRELILHRAAAAAGIAPEIVAAASDGSVLVTRFIAGEVWTSAHFGSAASLQKLGQRLAQLHAIALPVVAGGAFDPPGIARQYLAARPDAAVDLQAEALVQWQQVTDAAREVAACTARLALVHGDPTHANLIDDGALWLIDWEYAQLADPVYDVAAVLAYYPAAQPHCDMLLAAAAQPGSVLDGPLAAAIRVHRGLGWLWQYARGDRFSSATGV
jgi:thiamine kinase